MKHADTRNQEFVPHLLVQTMLGCDFKVTAHLACFNQKYANTAITLYGDKVHTQLLLLRVEN